MGKSIGSVILLIVAAATGQLAWYWRAAILLATSAVTNKLFGPEIPNLDNQLQGKSVMKRSSTEYRNIVYGKAAAAGPIIYNNVGGTNRENLWYLIALCHGEIESVEEVWFDNNVIAVADIDWTPGGSGAEGSGTGGISTSLWVDSQTSTKAAYAWWTLGNANQVAMSQLTTPFGQWTSNHRARGVPLLLVKWVYNKDTETIWQAGVPRNIFAVIKGRKLYDPRLDSTRTIAQTSPLTKGSGAHRLTDSTTWAWSDNPALCVADYLTQIMGVAATDIDWPSIADAADDCDVLVPIDTSSPEKTETRFTCNGSLSLGASHKDNLDALLSSFEGKLSYSGGTWKLRASVWEASSVSFDQDDIVDDLEIRGSAPRSERFNTVRGVFTDPDRNYKPCEFPIATNSNYVVRDNSKTIYNDLALPMTNSATMAQRIAFRLIEQADNQVVMKAKVNARGSKCTVGDVVTWDLPELGWTAGGNRALYSEDLSNAQWAKTRVTTTQSISSAPDGSATANSINEDGTAADSHFVQQASISFTAGNKYTASVYLKASNRDWARIDLNGTGGTTKTNECYFDLGGGVRGGVGTTDSLIDYGIDTDQDGWLRCWVSVETDATNTGLNLNIVVAEGDGDITFDGLSQESILFWGAQVVEGTDVGRYHKTTSAVVTTTTKTFRVIEWQPNGNGTYDITFKEDESASYDDPAGADYTDGNTGTLSIPSPVVPPPTGLSASSIPYGVRLNWTNPASHEFDYIDVYASTDSSWSNAGKIASIRSDFYRYDATTSTIRYFWIRARRNSGDVSLRVPDSDTSTVIGTAGGSTDSVNLVGATLSDTQTAATAEVGYRLTSGGLEQSYEANASPLPWSTIATWLNEGTAGSYFVKLTKTSGTDPSSGTLGSQLQLNTTREWIWQDTSQGDSAVTFEGTVEIYDNSSPQNVFASATLTVSCENQDPTVSLSGASYSGIVTSGTNATTSFRVDNDGNFYRIANGGTPVQINTATDWIRPTTEAPGSYQVRYTSATGDTGSLSATTSENTWHPLSSGDWTITVTDSTPLVGGKSATFTIQIGQGSPISVLDSASYTLSADREDGV